MCSLRMPVAICDNDVNKQGTKMYNIPVMSFDDACNRFDNINVVITNDVYMEEILQQVTEKIPSKQVRYYFQRELFGHRVKNKELLINRFIRNRDEYKNLVFFGAGEYLDKVMSFFEFCDISKPVAICDNDIGKQGAILYDIPVISFDDAYDEFGNDMYIVITSVNINVQLEILYQITRKIHTENIYFFSYQDMPRLKSDYMAEKDGRLVDPEYIKDKLKYYYDLYDKGENIRIENDNYFIKADEKYVDLIDYMDRENVNNIHKIKVNDDVFLINKYNIHPRKVFMENDYIEKSVENIISFNKYLSSKNIPFVYIQAPHIVSSLKGNNFENLYNDVNRHADKFIQKLNENNINTLDFRDYVMKNNIKTEDWFFRTDFHWTPRAAFEANKVICEYIAKHIDCEFNYEYFDLKNYNIETYEDVFLGNIGKIVGLLYSEGGENFEMITPRFKTDFSWICEEKRYNNRGEAKDVLVFHEQLKRVYYKGTMYSSYSLAHELYTIIKNNINKNNKKLMLINDSFVKPLSMFISQQFEEVHLFDFRQDDFNRKLFEAIEEVKPDMVLMMYSLPPTLKDANGFDVGYYA